MKVKMSFGIVGMKRHRDRMVFLLNSSSIIDLSCKMISCDPLSLSDYRLIGLIGCVYKIIAKVLASRLKKVISYVIDEIQLAYTEERNIPDH
uniref:Uncharacterized protein n=1 Tax=Lactuca sativa TaxID=4236 RepID=A0A9R1WWP2_LACSA|nr:hypothetical protein LSAT_V11C800411530 [Lactuca sativa]